MCSSEEWALAQIKGEYSGSSQDQADGFIHFSTKSQIRSSAAKHRAGQGGLVLLSVDPEKLNKLIKWELARGGELFPHVYGNLPLNAVERVDPLPLNADGVHQFPEYINGD
ncbi:MAG: glutathione S-transferase [Magnetovibrio sp.]|nr:glutathione S-transferase [Magnetovibrio sp.]